MTVVLTDWLTDYIYCFRLFDVADVVVAAMSFAGRDYTAWASGCVVAHCLTTRADSFLTHKGSANAVLYVGLSC